MLVYERLHFPENIGKYSKNLSIHFVTFYNSMKCFIDVCSKLICNPCKYFWNKYEYEKDESTFMIVCKYI